MSGSIQQIAANCDFADQLMMQFAAHQSVQCKVRSVEWNWAEGCGVFEIYETQETLVASILITFYSFAGGSSLSICVAWLAG